MTNNDERTIKNYGLLVILPPIFNSIPKNMTTLLTALGQEVKIKFGINLFFGEKTCIF